MRIRRTLRNYRFAIATASKGTLRNLPSAALGVLRSRVRYGLGPEFHSLYDFRNKPEADWRAYMTDNDGVRVLERLSPPSAHRFLRDKLAFSLHCIRHRLAIVPTLLRYDREHCSSLDEIAPNVDSIAEWEAALASAPDRLFCKLIDGRLGIGAFKAERLGEEWVFDGTRGCAADFRDFALKRLGKGRGWLFQPALLPHPALAEIMTPGALGTLRAITYIDADGVQVAFPLLRIPASGNIVDNFARGTRGNLVASIDASSGRLSAARYSRSAAWPDLVSLERHIDTGKVIQGREVPFWAEAKALMITAQAATPDPPTIGWDIAITAEGPQIVEANSQYSTALCQVAYARGIRPDFERAIERIRKHRAEGAHSSSSDHAARPAPEP